jgi:hypothetical protein
MTDPIDIQKILGEYLSDLDDFGFSAVSEEEYNQVLTEADQTVENYKARLAELEKLIVPFLVKLIKTADKEYIYWPNRKAQIEMQLERIVRLTRS